MKWYKLLKPREPKWRREWRYKIGLAFIIALLAYGAILAWSNSDDVGDALGWYNPRTDDIWVDNTLDEGMYEMVMTHELAHRAFYDVFPFWTYVKFGLGSSMLFVMFMGVLTLKKRFFYTCMLMMFIAGIHETHAYGWSMIVHGFEANSFMGLFMFGVFPLVLLAVTRYVKFKKKVKVAYKVIVSRFGTRKLRRRIDILENAQALSMFYVGFIAALALAGSIKWYILALLLWSWCFFSIAVSMEIKKMGMGICRFKRVRKTRGRPKKLKEK